MGVPSVTYHVARTASSFGRGSRLVLEEEAVEQFFGTVIGPPFVATEGKWLRGKRASSCPAHQRRLRQRCMLGYHALGAGQHDLAECWPARALAQGQRYAIAYADGACVHKVQLITLPAGGQAAESAESFAASTAAAGCCWQPAGGAGGGEQADFDAHPHF